jgi:hypothetical protein
MVKIIYPDYELINNKKEEILPDKLREEIEKQNKYNIENILNYHINQK